MAVGLFHLLQFAFCVDHDFIRAGGNVHTGTEQFAKRTRARHPDLPVPVYHNALNHYLDPVRRRFRRVSETMSDAPSNAPPVALVEFTGALPRALLFADWESGVDEATAGEMLFSPGFDPRARVLVRQPNLPVPEQPSQASNLPTVKIVRAEATRVELKIPFTDYNTVLMLNDRFDANWTATVDFAPAPLLRANNHARAVYLPAAERDRTVIFEYQPPAVPATPAHAALFLGLAFAAYGTHAARRRPKQVDEPETPPDEA